MFTISVSALVTLVLMPRTIDHPVLGQVVIPKLNSFDIAALEAQSVYVYDVTNKKVIYSKNADDIRPLASITKTMTAYTSLDFYNPATSTITITQQDLASEGDTGLLSGEVWRYKDLRDFTMLTSSNDGATALAAKPGFIEKMNSDAAALGLTSLKFTNETGLDTNPLVSGSYGSAKDVALLFSHILVTHPEVLDITRKDDHVFTSLSGNRHFAKNTDVAVNKIPGILASKTGYTDLAQGNLVIAFDAEIGHPIVIVVLGSSYDGRFKDVVALASSTRSYFFGN